MGTLKRSLSTISRQPSLLQFKKRIKSIAVDGSDVLSAAMEAAKRASPRLEAKEAAAKAKAKKKEESTRRKMTIFRCR